MRRNRRQGFTLIELMLVIVIIATLAAIVATNIAGKGQEAKIGAAKQQISNLESALDMFEAECGRYPTTAEGLEALRTAPSGIKNWKGPYMKKEIPLDPWQNPYGYRSPGQHGASSVDLWSNGPDGQEGTDDDIQNWNLDKVKK
jgi:general secretion pathway protein G